MFTWMRCMRVCVFKMFWHIKFEKTCHKWREHAANNSMSHWLRTKWHPKLIFIFCGIWSSFSIHFESLGFIADSWYQWVILAMHELLISFKWRFYYFFSITKYLLENLTRLRFFSRRIMLTGRKSRDFWHFEAWSSSRWIISCWSGGTRVYFSKPNDMAVLCSYRTKNCIKFRIHFSANENALENSA